MIKNNENINNTLTSDNDEKATLICDINPYGDLDFKKLKKWYMKHGFEENGDSQLILKK